MDSSPSKCLNITMEEEQKSSKAISYFRNFIFGVEDSLVSTVGLLSGIAIADMPRNVIFLTGVVLIFVEAFSMGAGSFLSESSAERFAKKEGATVRKNLVAGTIMFFSYFVSGFVPLFPYLVWPVGTALIVSIIFSIIALFILGIIGAKISEVSILKNGLRMALIGGMAIGVGFLAGILVTKI